MKFKDLIANLGAYSVMFFMFLGMPLAFYGIMSIFGIEWWKAGIALILLQMIPLINIAGTVAFAVIGIYYLIADVIKILTS